MDNSYQTTLFVAATKQMKLVGALRATISFLFLFCSISCSTTGKTSGNVPGHRASIQSNLIASFRDPGGATLQTPDRILRTLFEETPSEITVYPSEFYWYFQIPIAGSWIKGTVVWDLDRPNVELSYYQLRRNFLPSGDENYDTGKKDGWVGDLAKDLGCQVGPVEKDDQGLVRRVSCYGIAKVFHYPFLNQNFEANRTRLKTAGALKENEEYWADFIDESGLKLSGIFLPDEKAMIEVLHPDDERLVRLTYYPKQQVYHDGNSDFVFYKDGSRLVLIGVYKFHVLENNMFDGPHDQLPHADMWAGHIKKIGTIIPKLSSYLGEASKVDDFGNLKNYPGARFVVANHFNYQHIREFDYVPRCKKKKKGFYECLMGQNKK